MTEGLVIRQVRGSELRAALPELAQLRIDVFREYPYLYEGSPEYEQRYLAPYVESAASCLVIARDGQRVVGASTAIPLLAHDDAVAVPIGSLGIDPKDVYYFGESVLLAPYRGRGIGHAFFDLREAAARAQGFRITAFCAVDRPIDHPRRPAQYVPHDGFWERRGYSKQPDLVVQFAWRDLGQPQPTPKSMVFWLKELGP